MASVLTSGWPMVPSRLAGLLRPIGVVAIVAAFLAAYYPTLRGLSEYWVANETYSFGFLVPLISAYLLWLRRDRLNELPWTPNILAGSVGLATGLFTLIVGRLSSINLLEQFSIPITVWGLALLVLGRQLTQRMTFPLLYLCAMLPFWDFFTARLHLPFQLYSAAIGVKALRLFGIPVLRDGVFIELPNITLEVAQLCSGVNNLIAVLCLGVPLTHHYVVGWLKRGFIMAVAVLIALLSNGIRVATVCFFAYYEIRGADGDIHGPFSLMRTLAISGVGFVALFSLVGKFADRVDTPVKPEKPAVVIDSPHWGLHGAAWLLAVALFAGAVGYEQLHAITRVPLKVNLVAFPNKIAGWQFARVGSVLPSLASHANFDHWMSRVYAGPDGEVELLLGYFELQQPGKELGGWGLSQVIPSESMAVASDMARVRDGLTRVNGTTYHLTYWYLIDGRVATAGYEAKLWTTFNAITAGRSNGGLIVISRALGPNESIDTSRSKVNAFINDVMRASAIYFPQG